MNRFSQIVAWARSRNGLIAIASVLVLLNVGRYATNTYLDVLAGIESKQALLGQHRISTRNIDKLRKRIAQLEQRKKEFDTHLFTGATRKEVTSAMQIKLQEILGSSGLSPESLRPLSKSRKVSDMYYGEVIIKLRLSGSLDDFIRFLAGLYRSNYLFKIENFTIKPYKKKELKVFLELKGYYRLTGDGAQGLQRA